MIIIKNSQWVLRNKAFWRNLCWNKNVRRLEKRWRKIFEISIIFTSHTSNLSTSIRVFQEDKVLTTWRTNARVRFKLTRIVWNLANLIISRARLPEEEKEKDVFFRLITRPARVGWIKMAVLVFRELSDQQHFVSVIRYWRKNKRKTKGERAGGGRERQVLLSQRIRDGRRSPT